ncbi:hypothetical protein J2Y63_002395 [Shinella sp. BE166]|uniref:hypothetical protein n=1 Tax=Shinella sp. BE166 TaxID=3373918 RepID=UPI003EB6E1C6
MSKDSILDYSTTASENQDIGGTSILGTAKPSNLDDAMRTEMAHIAKGLVTRRAAKDTAYTAVKADHNQLIEFSEEATLTTSSAATLTDGWQCKVYAQGGAVTINPNGSETVNGEEFIALTVGSSGILSVNNGNFRFEYFGGEDKARFKANKNGTNQTLTDAATIVTFGTEVYDVGSMYDTATSRFTPPSGRAFRIYAQLAVSITSGQRSVECRLLKNGTSIAIGYDNAESTMVANPKVTDVVVGNGTDYYEIQINNLTSGGAYPIRGAITDTYFMAEEL